jgi:hypothetical protein
VPISGSRLYSWLRLAVQKRDCEALRRLYDATGAKGDELAMLDQRWRA